jgi:fructoselysine-6-P-deglycase FrlB-like protein
MSGFKEQIIDDTLKTIQLDGYNDYTLCCIYYYIMLNMKESEDTNHELFQVLERYTCHIINLTEKIANIDFKKKQTKLIPDNLMYWRDEIRDYAEPILCEIETYFENEKLVF